MIKARRGLGFAPKTGERFARIRVKVQNALQRNDAERMSLTCPINDAHAAAPDFFQDLIITNPPVGIADINVIENSLQRLGSFSFAPETAAKQTIQTKPAPDARCRSAFFTCDDIGVDSHRIGKIAHAHGWFMWWLLRELRIDTAAHHRYPPVSPLFAPPLPAKDGDNVPAIGGRVVLRTPRECPEIWRAFDTKRPGDPLPNNHSAHRRRGADRALRILRPVVVTRVPPRQQPIAHRKFFPPARSQLRVPGSTNATALQPSTHPRKQISCRRHVCAPASGFCRQPENSAQP